MKKPLARNILIISILLLGTISWLLMGKEKQTTSLDDEASSKSVKQSHPRLRKSEFSSLAVVQDKDIKEEPDDVVFWELERQPFKVTQETECFKWTSDPLMTADELKAVTNNEVMLQRFLDSNFYTKERQLVYVKEQFESNAQSFYNEESDTLVVPGLNGEEYTLKLEPGNLFKLEVAEDDVFEGIAPGGFIATVQGVEGAEASVGFSEHSWSIDINFPSGKSIDIEQRPNMANEWVVSDVDLRAKDATQRLGSCPEGRDIFDLSSSQ